MHLWTPFFFISLIVTFGVTAIVARIYPLSSKPETYYQEKRDIRKKNWRGAFESRMERRTPDL